MACSDKIASLLVCEGEHLSPLDSVIAEDARIGRATGHIFIDKIGNNALPERFAEIDDMVLEAHAFGVMLRFHDGLDRTASFLFCETGVFHRVIGAVSDTDHLIALLYEEHG